MTLSRWTSRRWHEKRCWNVWFDIATLSLWRNIAANDKAPLYSFCYIHSRRPHLRAKIRMMPITYKQHTTIKITSEPAILCYELHLLQSNIWYLIRNYINNNLLLLILHPRTKVMYSWAMQFCALTTSTTLLVVAYTYICIVIYIAIYYYNYNNEVNISQRLRIIFYLELCLKRF